jgi:hypothetical protein
MKSLLFGTAVFLAALLSGCGASRKTSVSDPVAFVKEGKCRNARLSAESSQNIDPQTRRAVIAMCAIIDRPDEKSVEKAVARLREESGPMHFAASASEMLALAPLLPKSISPETSLLLSRAALGAVGFGPSAPPGSVPVDAVGTATRDLSVSVLERISLALEAPSMSIGADELLIYWNSCFRLLGGAFEAENDLQAWRLYKAVAKIAVFASNAAPAADITQALLGAAVNTVEANPPIQTAVRCDLSSPFASLKNALAYNRPLLSRLEFAVKDAVGCIRGTFAP